MVVVVDGTYQWLCLTHTIPCCTESCDKHNAHKYSTIQHSAMIQLYSFNYTGYWKDTSCCGNQILKIHYMHAVIKIKKSNLPFKLSIVKFWIYINNNKRKKITNAVIHQNTVKRPCPDVFPLLKADWSCVRWCFALPRWTVFFELYMAVTFVTMTNSNTAVNKHNFAVW